MEILLKHSKTAREHDQEIQQSQTADKPVATQGRATQHKPYLSYDIASGSEITPCNKIDKPLVVYRFTGNVMTSITTLRT